MKAKAFKPEYFLFERKYSLKGKRIITMKYFKRLTGERLYLSPMNPDDAEIYTKWVNDPEVANFMSFRTMLISIATERKALENMADGKFGFSIVRLEDDELIGSIGLEDINNFSRRATLGILIGEAENRSKGYGAEAIRLLLDYGFNTLNLHNIELTLNGDNERALACYKKVGFKEYGRRREGMFKNGKYMDYICMDILAGEFNEKYGK